ncbi:MAG: response regulator [Chlamydiota bacterium]
MKADYQQIIASALEHLQGLIQRVKTDYNIAVLQALKKDVSTIETKSSLYGYGEISALCHQLNLDLTIKINNFGFTTADPLWFESLDNFIKKIQDALATNKKTTQQLSIVMNKTPQKKKIIIVDDDEDLLKLLDYELHEIGFETENFTTGESALKFLLNERNLNEVLLLILDRMLPDMDGLEILQKFSKQSSIKIPTLILSALSTEGEVIEGLQTGAIDYITKPFSVFMLMQKVLNLLKTQST